MGKHVNTKVKCFGCLSYFASSKLKTPDEIYKCTKCDHNHIAGVNEEKGTWEHEDYGDDEC